MLDLLFYTHASKFCGFGHAARSAKLTKIINDLMPSLKIGFEGEFTEKSKTVIKNIANPVFTKNAKAKVGIYDRMDDVEDPFYFDAEKLDNLCKNSETVIFMANSYLMPSLPEKVIVVGYKVGQENQCRTKNRFWGLEYSPVEINEKNYKDVYVNPGLAFIALGGGDNPAGSNKIIKAISHINEIKRCRVLLSPVNTFDIELTTDNKTPELELIKNVPNLALPIRESEIVIASYGHLAYEAMAYGKPVCLIGQKDFQVEFAQRLANKNLCINGGNLFLNTEDQLIFAIRKTLSQKKHLSANAIKTIDGQGLKRIAEIILSYI